MIPQVFLRKGKESWWRDAQERRRYQDGGRDCRSMVTNPGMLGQLTEAGRGKEWILP